MRIRGARHLAAALVTFLCAAAPAAADEPSTIVHDDVRPSLTVFSSGDTSVVLGGLIQLHVAPYVGDDSQLADQDPAGRAGFRLRRARFGVSASLPSDLGFLLILNPLESDPDTGTISEARVSWSPRRWLRVWAGADKVPFSHGELVSSSQLSSIERPLAVRTLVPQNRLGAAIEGAVADDLLAYTAGVMNATEGYEPGNQFSGLLGVARLQLQLPRSLPVHVTLGLGGYYENGPATRVTAGSADLDVTAGPASVLVEAICDRTTPEDAPETSPEIPDAVKRCGGYAEAGWRLPKPDLQIIARLEYMDDNLDVDDAGDSWLVAAGLNWQPAAHMRLQLHYLGRYERHGAERANDSVILAVQGEL